MKKIAFISLGILSFFGALGLIEVYLRVGEIEPPLWTTIDSTVGIVNIPNRPILYLSESYYLGATNTFGYFGAARSRGKRPGTYRFVLLGNSFVSGINVDEKYYFGRLMETALEEHWKKPVEVLNFGFGRFDLSDIYCYYKKVVNGFDYDCAVFFVDTSDFAESYYKNMGPYCVVKPDSIAIVDDYKYGGKYRLYDNTRFITQNSSLFRLVFKCEGLIATQETGHIILDKLYWKNPADKRMAGTEKGFNETTKMILRQLAKDPRNIIVYKYGVPSDIDRFIRSTGISVYSLEPCLNALQQEGIDPYFWKATKTRGHWNHAAHKAIGMYLAGQLSSRFGDDILQPAVRK